MLSYYKKVWISNNIQWWVIKGFLPRQWHILLVIIFLCFYVYITGCIKEWLGDAEHSYNLFLPLPWLPFLQSNEKWYTNNLTPLSNKITVSIPLQNNNSEVASALFLYIHVSQYLKRVFYVPDITFFCTLYTFSILIIQQSHEIFIIVIPHLKEDESEVEGS